MFEQGLYGRHAVSPRVANTEGSWGGALYRRRDKCRVSCQSSRAAAVDRGASANGGAGSRGGIGFERGFPLGLLIGVAPDAEEERILAA